MDDPAAFKDLYDGLRRAAAAMLRGERGGHTLTATALVHEAFLRLKDGDYREPAAYARAATTAMRRILIDHARARAADKRGGSQIHHVELTGDALALAVEDRCEEILALDEAIERLSHQDGHLAEVVRMKFFAGLETRDIAAALGVSERTIKRDWQYARAALFRLLSGKDEST